MNKLKLTLKEEDIDFRPEDLESEAEEKEIDAEIFQKPDSDEIDFITSDKLDEIREILLDIPEDIRLLLLNDSTVVLGTFEDEDTFLYSLDPEENFFDLVKLPNKLEEILNDDNIIKYTEEQTDPRHDKIIELLMQKLVVDEPEDTVPEDKPEESTEVENTEIAEEPEEEVEDDEQKA